MKKLLLGLLFCPLFMFGQNVSKVDLSNIPFGVNVAVVSGMNTDSCFSKIVSAIKSQGLFFDRLDKENGIITTSINIVLKESFISYCLQVYLEKNELQIRVFTIQDLGETSARNWLHQVYNSDTKSAKRNFSFLVYWAEKIGEVTKGKVVYKRESDTSE